MLILEFLEWIDKVVDEGEPTDIFYLFSVLNQTLAGRQKEKNRNSQSIFLMAKCKQWGLKVPYWVPCCLIYLVMTWKVGQNFQIAQIYLIYLS